jgi:hypothetical protein
MDFNLQNRKKKVLWVVNIVLISIAMLITVFADDLSNISTQLKGYTSYVYPDMGKEHILGPEKTVYYAIHYDGNGKVEYGEIIRQADDFVLERVYPDGNYIEFTPPSLTEEQKQKFIDKYDPAKIKKRMAEEEKELAKKIDKRYADLIEDGLVKLTKGDNYIIYTYTRADKEVFRQFSGFFEGVYYDNTIERNYDFNVDDVKDKIDNVLKNASIKIPLKVSIVPYQCQDLPEGEMQYTMFQEDNNQYELHILLFNNELSMEEQFNRQFKKYLQETKRVK